MSANIIIMPEDHWTYEDDVILCSALKGNEFNNKVLEGNERELSLLLIRDAAEEAEFSLSDDEDKMGWTRLQTKRLYEHLNTGDYNLSRIQCVEPELRNKVMLDLHDRAIILLVLHELLVTDPVEFLHSKKHVHYKLSMRTLAVATSAFRKQHFFYHKYYGHSSKAPAKLVNSYNIKLAKANEIINDYFKCYYNMQHQSDFKHRFKVVLHEMNCTTLHLCP